MMTIADIPVHDLPIWMRKARRRVDWGALLTLAFSLVIGWAFILQPGLPRTNASENYVFMTAAYATALQEGTLYPRWSPDAFGGYGAPIPNFYPPGAAYTAALVQILVTGDPVNAVRMVYTLALCLAGGATYTLVTRRVGGGHGLLAGLLYVTSPYVGLTAPHILGDLPGVIGMALTPALLWAADRLLVSNRPVDVLLVTLITSALILTDPHGAAVALALALLLTIWHVRFVRRDSPWLSVLLGGALGIGAASCYWLPALLEQSYVQWRVYSERLPLKLALPSLVMPLRSIDLAEMIPTPQLTIGAVRAALAAASGAAMAFRRRAVGFQALFLLAGIVLVALALLAFPTEIGLLGPIMLCLSIGTTGLLTLRQSLPARAQRIALPAAVIILLNTALPVWLTPRWQTEFGDTSPRANIEYEQLGYGIAVVPVGMPVPTTLPENLPFNRTLVSSYQTDVVNKIQLPRGSRAWVGVLKHESHGDQFQIQTTRTTVIEVLTAYFPGWQAALPSGAVPLSRNPETGLLRATLPPGINSTLTVSMGTTSARSSAWAVSWATLGIALLITWGRFRRTHESYDDLTLLPLPEARLLALILGVFVVVIAVLVRAPSPMLYPRPGYEVDGSYALRYQTDVGLEALAYDLPQSTYATGALLNLTLYWRALRFLPDNYRVQLYLLNLQTEQRWNVSALRHPGGYPTRRWLPFQYVADRYQFRLPADFPTGEYVIGIDAFTCKPACAPQDKLTFFDRTGKFIGRFLFLPVFLTITNP